MNWTEICWPVYFISVAFNATLKNEKTLILRHRCVVVKHLRASVIILRTDFIRESIFLYFIHAVYIALAKQFMVDMVYEYLCRHSVRQTKSRRCVELLYVAAVNTSEVALNTLGHAIVPCVEPKRCTMYDVWRSFAPTKTASALKAVVLCARFTRGILGTGTCCGLWRHGNSSEALRS